LDSEIAKATKKLETVQTAIEQVKNAREVKSNPIDFLALIEDCEEEMRTATHVSEPKVEPRWFRLPQLRLNHIEEILKTLRYKENPYGEYGRNHFTVQKRMQKCSHSYSYCLKLNNVFFLR
jgi:hypothetical protein